MALDSLNMQLQKLKAGQHRGLGRSVLYSQHGTGCFWRNPASKCRRQGIRGQIEKAQSDATMATAAVTVQCRPSSPSQLEPNWADHQKKSEKKSTNAKKMRATAL
jgi:hypothetical protein